MTAPRRSTRRCRRPCPRASRCSRSLRPRTRTPSSSPRTPPSQWSLKAIADLAAAPAELSIGAPPEFKTRPAGPVGLKSVYNIVPNEFRPLQSQATVEALKNGQVKAANIFTTDPSIVANGFVVARGPEEPLRLRQRRAARAHRGRPTQLKEALNAVSEARHPGSGRHGQAGGHGQEGRQRGREDLARLLTLAAAEHRRRGPRDGRGGLCCVAR